MIATDIAGLTGDAEALERLGFPLVIVPTDVAATGPGRQDHSSRGRAPAAFSAMITVGNDMIRGRAASGTGGPGSCLRA